MSNAASEGRVEFTVLMSNGDLHVFKTKKETLDFVSAIRVVLPPQWDGEEVHVSFTVRRLIRHGAQPWEHP